MKKRYILYIGTLVILFIFLIKRNTEKNIIRPDIIIPPPEWNMLEAEETMPKIKDIIADGEKTMIPFHDWKDAQVDPESCKQDFSGNWERVTAGDIAGMAQEDGGPLPIADICAGSDNVLFLTKNGQVFISEYVTSEVRDVDYYNNMNTNPYRERTLTAWDLEIKELSFRKLDWENIVSINTDGTCHFTAVDENGECFYMDTESAINLIPFQTSLKIDFCFRGNRDRLLDFPRQSV